MNLNRNFIFEFSISDIDVCNQKKEVNIIDRNEENTTFLDPTNISGIVLGNNRYRIIDAIQDKRNTIIYKAHDRLLNRHICIEVLKKNLKFNDVSHKIYHIEGEKTEYLCHKNIMSVYDTGWENGVAYTVKEYVGIQTLEDYLKENPKIYLCQAVRFIRQIIEGLKYAHEYGIIHTDLCPKNIFINGNGDLKINYNYVSAKAEEKEDYNYISPEQAMNRNVTYQSDIYSLGCMMFRLFIGRTPFKEESFISLATNHIRKIPGSPMLINGSIPQSISKAIQKALAKNPQDRHYSYEELLKDLLY